MRDGKGDTVLTFFGSITPSEWNNQGLQKIMGIKQDE